MVVVLPVPLTPTTRITCGDFRSAATQRPGHRRQDALDLGGKHRAHVLRADAFVVAALRQGVRDPRGGLDPEIRLDQQVLQLLERLLIELALGEQAGDVLPTASTMSW